jgi:hypothetical protein
MPALLGVHQRHFGIMGTIMIAVAASGKQRRRVDE